ncbi:hypothetical protein B9J76_14510 [Lacticaseibacillus paracasei]|nr:hypothetical protein B9J76_14510 [Lacticaseibacillus paracasei]
MLRLGTRIFKFFLTIYEKQRRLIGAVPRQVDSSNIKKLFSCYFQVRDKLIINFGSPPGLPFLIQALS